MNKNIWLKIILILIIQILVSGFLLYYSGKTINKIDMVFSEGLEQESSRILLVQELALLLKDFDYNITKKYIANTDTSKSLFTESTAWQNQWKDKSSKLRNLAIQKGKVDEIINSSAKWKEMESKIAKISNIIKEKKSQEVDTLISVNKLIDSYTNAIKTSISSNRNPKLTPIFQKIQNSIPGEINFYRSYLLQNYPVSSDTIWVMRDKKDTTSLGYNYNLLKEIKLESSTPLGPIVDNIEKSIINFRASEKYLLDYHSSIADSMRIRDKHISNLHNSVYKTITDLNVVFGNPKDKVKKFEDKAYNEIIEKSLIIMLVSVGVGVLLSFGLLFAIASEKAKSLPKPRESEAEETEESTESTADTETVEETPSEEIKEEKKIVQSTKPLEAVPTKSLDTEKKPTVPKIASADELEEVELESSRTEEETKSSELEIGSIELEPISVDTDEEVSSKSLTEPPQLDLEELPSISIEEEKETKKSKDSGLDLPPLELSTTTDEISISEEEPLEITDDVIVEDAQPADETSDDIVISLDDEDEYKPT